MVADSNRRYESPRTHAFQACAFNHSANHPYAIYFITERKLVFDLAGDDSNIDGFDASGAEQFASGNDGGSSGIDIVDQ